jgi:hypothetical protein
MPLHISPSASTTVPDSHVGGIVLAVQKAKSHGGTDFSIKFHAEQADSAAIQSAVFLRALRVLHVNELGEP